MLFRVLSASCLLLLLTACGGGSGSGPSVTGAGVIPELLVVRIESSNTNPSLAFEGDTVTVTIVASEPINSPAVTIGGIDATAITGSGAQWTASRLITANEADPTLSLVIGFTDLDGQAGIPVTSTLDGSAVEFTNSVLEEITQNVFLDAVDPVWTRGITAFDQGVNFASDCTDGGNATFDDIGPCPSIGWEEIASDDAARGQVIQVTHAEGTANISGLFIGATNAGGVDDRLNLSDFIGGTLNFDINIVNVGATADGTANSGVFILQIDCSFPCTSGRQSFGEADGFIAGATGWQSVSVPISRFVDGGLDLSIVSTGIVIFPDEGQQSNAVFQLDNVRWEGLAVPDGTPTFNSVAISSSNADPAIAQEGDTLTVNVDFIDAPADTPVVSIGGVDAMVSGSGTSFIATRVVAAGESGNFDVLVSFTDTAGNALTLNAATTDSSAITLFVPMTFVGAPGVFDDALDAQWVDGIQAFDEAIGFQSCANDEGAECPSISFVSVAADDATRGQVMEVTYSGAQFAGLILGFNSAGIDFSRFAGGSIEFDINVTANPNSVPLIAKADCVGCPVDAGQREQNLGVPAAGWQSISIAIDDLVNANGGPADGGLVLESVTTGLVIFAPFGQTEGVSFQLDNVRWVRSVSQQNFSVFEDSLSTSWMGGLSAFDQAIGFQSCTNDGGAGCPSIAWNSIAGDAARGQILDVTYSGNQFAGIIVGIDPEGIDLTDYAAGNLVFDINVTANPNNVDMIMKADCTGCPVDAGQREQNLGLLEPGWRTVTVPVADLINANGGPTDGGLVIGSVTTGLVIFPPFGSTEGVAFQLDNVRWELPTPPATGDVFNNSLAPQWMGGLSAFDQAIGFQSCSNDGGEGCPSIGWASVAGSAARGQVLEVTYSGDQFAGIIVGIDPEGLDLTDYASGNVVFDINVTANPNGVDMIMKADCTGCPVDAGQREQNLGLLEPGWRTVSVPVADLVNANGGPTDGGLVVNSVTTGLVIFPPFGSTQGVVFQLDNVRWELSTPVVTGSVFTDSVAPQWMSGLSAFDQAIGFQSCSNDGGEGCPSISWASIAGDAARGQIIEVTYAGDQFAGIIVGLDPEGLDLTDFAGGNLSFDINVTANPNNVDMVMKADCNGCATDAGQREQNLGLLEPGWRTISVPVADLVNANGGPTVDGLVISTVTTGLVIFPPFGSTAGVAFQLDNVRWESQSP